MWKNTGTNATVGGEFTDGDAMLGVPRSILGAVYMNMLLRENQNAVLGSGLALTEGDEHQLAKAIRRWADKFGRSIVFADSPATMTADHAGLVLVDATAGSVVINLPAANTASRPRYLFVRGDATGNAVTINRAGADTIEAATSVTLAVGDRLPLHSDGTATWYQPRVLIASQALAEAGVDGVRLMTPLRTKQAMTALFDECASVGTQIGYKRTASSTATNTATAMPSGTSLPLSSEGAQLAGVTTAYAAKRATSLLEIELTLPIVSFSGDANGRGAVAIFRGTTCIASLVMRLAPTSSDVIAAPVVLRASIAAANTSENEYTARYGPTAVGNMHINEMAGAGGSNAARVAVLSIKEIKQ